MKTVAALYIDPRGPYPKLPGVDCWDEARDARLYDGPHSVVAHPACGPWGKLHHMYKGGEGGRELAFRAIEQVRKFGGVLEHPSNSKAFNAGCLPYPGELPDAFGGRTIALNQSDWGHACRKPTWLYLVRVPMSAVTSPPFPGRAPTHWISGSRKGKQAWAERTGDKVTPVPEGIRVAHAAMRKRTPPLFAQWLVELARSAK